MSEINIKTSGQPEIGNRERLKPNGSASNAVPASPTAQSTADKVSFTATAEQLQSLQHIVAAAPAENADKVAELRAAIENGSYTVDTLKLAQNLLRSEEQFD